MSLASRKRRRDRRRLERVRRWLEGEGLPPRGTLLKEWARYAREDRRDRRKHAAWLDVAEAKARLGMLGYICECCDQRGWMESEAGWKPPDERMLGPAAATLRIGEAVARGFVEGAVWDELQEWRSAVGEGHP